MEKVALKILHLSSGCAQIVERMNHWSVETDAETGLPYIALSASNETHTDWAVRCVVNKWKFQDAMMGEQCITFDITSEKPIDFAVGDFCVFRGEVFTLNYIPSVTQKARTGERQDSYTYSNVKMDSRQEELTRCTMLDITPSSPLYNAVLGTNYTGSSRFQLFCGEQTFNGSTYTAVCALALKMQANLDRFFGSDVWSIYVDTLSTVVDATGKTVLATHSDDKVLSFDNMTVSKALEEVHNTFDLDYSIRGRSIFIGYTPRNLTSDDNASAFYLGYGRGNASLENQGKGLFELKRRADSQQKIVTRLRVLGSTKNMPWRYYNKAYGLSQALFPTNLQLPGTFLPMTGTATQKRDGDLVNKTLENTARDSAHGIDSTTGLPFIRHVLGDTNDSYIDKGDNAAACAEGVREDSARWDGSNSDLEEIYPTISGLTYEDVRGAGLKDRDGENFAVATYPDIERIDELLAIGKYVDSTLVNDANIGDGILPEDGLSGSGFTGGKRRIDASLAETSLVWYSDGSGSFTNDDPYWFGPRSEFFVAHSCVADDYILENPESAPVFIRFKLSRVQSCDVAFHLHIYRKGIEGGAKTYVASYMTDFITAGSQSGAQTIVLPSLPDDVQISALHITELSDVTIEINPIITNISAGFNTFGLTYSITSQSDEAPELVWSRVTDYTTSPTANLTETFHVFIKDMGFDLSATFTSDTPVVAMKTGMCAGREFEIGEVIEAVTYNGKKGYMLTLTRATDESINAYYPSSNYPLAAGDQFVLLNINMPDAYIRMAEVRLLRAATLYLADNCNTRFTFQPSIDDIYLRRNLDAMLAAGTPEQSIFWRLYSGLMFSFRGIPSSDGTEVFGDITIDKVTVTMGNGITPKVELTLNDEVKSSAIEKMTTSLNRLNDGSFFANVSVGVGSSGGNVVAMEYILEAVRKEMRELYLSRKYNDEAAGQITFADTDVHEAQSKFKRGLRVGKFQSRLFGSGALIDEEGNAEFESIYSRSFISTPEFRFNRISVTDGEQWCTNGYGTIAKVEILDATTGYITLKLEENDYASVAVGDICRGIYNDIAREYVTADLDDDSTLYAGDDEASVSGFGFSCKSGFFTSYFWVKSFVVNKLGECKFIYELRNSSTPHPCAFMRFAQYGSFSDSSRRASNYETSIGHHYEVVLEGVSTWKIQSANVVYRKGYLGDMTVEQADGTERQLQGYGLYVQDNVYFGNAVIKLDPYTLAQLEDELRSYEIDFSGYVDVITVDDVGNCIGGLYTDTSYEEEVENEQAGETDTVTVTNRAYRIHSAITVRKSGTLLTEAASNADAAAGTYKLIAQPHGCTCIIENSTIYITGITNIKDGVAGSQDDVNFDYDAMRAMDSCYVDVIVDCEGKGSVQKKFPITIKHDSQPFVGADISNEFSGISWNTKTAAYIGLPISFSMGMWHNNESLPVTRVAINGVAGATTAQPSKNITVNGLTITTAISTNAHGEVVAMCYITAAPANLALVTNLNVTTTAVYAGVSYERSLVHTINKSTDTNVYSLLPIPTEVVLNKNANTLSSNTIDCEVVCDSTDDNHYTVAYANFASHGLVMYYRKIYTDGTQDANETLYEGSAVSINSGVAKVVFSLYGLTNGSVDRTIVHDSEGVPVIAEGLDGKGVEYIFFADEDWNDWDGTPNSVASLVTGGEASTTTGKPKILDVAADRQTDDYQPYTSSSHQYRWTDEPVGVGANLRIEFYAQRKKVNGVWQAFGDVKVWNRYTVDGESPYAIDLTNEQSFINCDDSGTPLSGATYEATDLMLFLGAAVAFNAFDSIKIVPVGISFTTPGNNGTTYCSYGVTPGTGETQCPNDGYQLTSGEITAAMSDGYYRITPSNIRQGAATITVTAVKSGLTLVAVYKINKNIAGQNGLIYSLIPSLNVIHKSNSGSYSDTTLTIQVKKTVGAISTILSTYSEISGEGLALSYTNSSGTKTSLTAASISTATFVGSSSGNTWGKLILKDSNNVVVDTERINVVKDGENAVRVDLDNEHVDFLYDDAGTLIAPSGGVSAQAHLYDGNTEKTSNATWRISDDGGATWGTSCSTNVTASIGGSTGALTVSALKSSSATIMIRAEYPTSSGKYYYSKFTANKINQDAHELILTPNSIAYNSANYATKSISISAQRTDLQGNVTDIGFGSYSNKSKISTTSGKGYLRLFVTYVKTTSGTDSTVTEQVTANSFSVLASGTSGCLASKNDSIYFELRKYADSSDSSYSIADYETVPITKAENGGDGEDASQVNPNMLLRTQFLSKENLKEKWNVNLNGNPDSSYDNYIVIYSQTSEQIEGRNCARIQNNDSGYTDLYQHVTLQANTWYTLSFWLKYTNSTTVKVFESYGGDAQGCISDLYVDGTHITSVSDDGHYEFNHPTWNPTKHVITFKTVSDLTGLHGGCIRFRVSTSGIAHFAMPKLELGQAATAYIPHEDDLVGVTYYITSSVPSVVIAANSSSVSVPAVTFNFYRKHGDSAPSLFKGCYYKIYIKNADGSLSYQDGATATNGTITISSGTYSLATGQSLVARMYSSSSSTEWLAEYEVQSIKVGDTGQGQAGAAGKGYYYLGEWTDVLGSTFVVSDYEAPFVSKDGYYYIFSGGNGTWTCSNTYSASNMTTGTPSANATAWKNKVSTNRFLISEAFFSEFAKLGSGVFNKDWMYSQYGEGSRQIWSSAYGQGINSTSMAIIGNNSFDVVAGREYTLLITGYAISDNVSIRCRVYYAGNYGTANVKITSTTSIVTELTFVAEYTGTASLYAQGVGTANENGYYGYVSKIAVTKSTSTDYQKMSPSFIGHDSISLLRTYDSSGGLTINGNNNYNIDHTAFVGHVQFRVVAGLSYRVRVDAAINASSGGKMRVYIIDGSGVLFSSNYIEVDSSTRKWYETVFTASSTGDVFLRVYANSNGSPSGSSGAYTGYIYNATIAAVDPFLPRVAIDWASGYAHFAGGNARFYPNGNFFIRGYMRRQPTILTPNSYLMRKQTVVCDCILQQNGVNNSHDYIRLVHQNSIALTPDLKQSGAWIVFDDDSWGTIKIELPFYAPYPLYLSGSLEGHIIYEEAYAVAVKAIDNVYYYPNGDDTPTSTSSAIAAVKSDCDRILVEAATFIGNIMEITNLSGSSIYLYGLKGKVSSGLSVEQEPWESFALQDGATIMVKCSDYGKPSDAGQSSLNRSAISIAWEILTYRTGLDIDISHYRNIV